MHTVFQHIWIITTLRNQLIVPLSAEQGKSGNGHMDSATTNVAV